MDRTINPPPKGELDKHGAPFPVLGLAQIAASLRAAGHEVEVLDGKLGSLSVDQDSRRCLSAAAPTWSESPA